MTVPSMLDLVTTEEATVAGAGGSSGAGGEMQSDDDFTIQKKKPRERVMDNWETLIIGVQARFVITYAMGHGDIPTELRAKKLMQCKLVDVTPEMARRIIDQDATVAQGLGNGCPRMWRSPRPRTRRKRRSSQRSLRSLSTHLR